MNLCFGIVDSAKDLLPVEDDPVGCEAAGGGEDFPDRAVGEAVPGVVPAAAHVTVDGVSDAEFPKAGEEGSKRQTPGAIDDAESSADLAKGPVAVRPVRLETAFELLPVMEKKTLAKAHPALLRRFFKGRARILVAEIEVVPPSVRSPCKYAVVGAAVEAFVERSAGDMVPGDIRVLEGREFLPREGRCAAEYDR